MASFDDLSVAAQMKEVLAKLVGGTLNATRPEYRYATVVSIDRLNRRCEVQYSGEPTTAIVGMGAVQPFKVGQVVRIDGRVGDRWIQDVMGRAFTAGMHMPGDMKHSSKLTDDDDWLLCNGRSLSKATFPDLAAVMLPYPSPNVTMTIATPAVFTLTAHGLVAGTPVYFTTTGALPTGVVAYTTYFVQNPTANTFNLNTGQSNSFLNATPGRVATTGSQSGTHTVSVTPFGPVTATNFSIPDLRGRSLIGMDTMGGTDGGVLDFEQFIGRTQGEQTTATHQHTEGTLQTAAGAVNNDTSSHWYNAQNPRLGGRGPTVSTNYTHFGMTLAIGGPYSVNHWTGVYGTTDLAGGATNLPPSMLVNVFIKT